MRTTGDELPRLEVGGHAQAPWRWERHRDFERAFAEIKLPERPECEAESHFLAKTLAGDCSLNGARFSRLDNGPMKNTISRST